MDLLCQYDMECDITLQKLNHFAESAFDSFFIESTEINNFNGLDDKTKEAMYSEAVADIGKKIVETIEKIIKAIKDFIGKAKDTVVNAFSNKDTSDKLDKAEAVIKADPSKGKEKVKINDPKDEERDRARLDKYIKEMALLERDLLLLKTRVSTDELKLDASQASIYAQEIFEKMRRLNDRYDHDFLDENSELIEMALADAIRFSRKQLENVKVDYNAVEANSEKVLAEFKKDADGCDVPVIYNGIQKMANSIGTRVRKFISKHTAFKRKSVGIVVAAAAALGIGKAVYNYVPGAKEKVNKAADKAIKKVIPVEIQIQKKK